MTRDKVLGAATPAALFGADAGDPKALKRAYARLIRAFGPDTDPAAFAHIRALYEQALAPPPTPAEPTDRPVDRLRRAFGAGDLDEALRLLVAHDLTLRVESPGVWFGAVVHLADQRTFTLPVELLQSWLDACDDPPDGLPLATVGRVETLTLAGIAYQEARRDPAIAGPLLDVIATWGQAPLVSAEALMALHRAEPDADRARANFAAMRARYPGLLMPWQLIVGGVTREHEAWVAAREGTWTPSTTPMVVRVGVPTADWLTASALCAVALLLWGQHVLAALALLNLCLSLVATRVWFRPAPAHDQLEQLTRDRALFPFEALADVHIEHSGHSWLARWFPGPAERARAAVCDWQLDPTALPATLTDAHLARIRART
jgi:hypothetical protein